jgi:hypothetical protein
MIVKSPIAFLPSLDSLASKLLTKVFTNKRMRIKNSRIVRIFLSEEPCSS